MNKAFVISRRVEFADTDMAGIVHFTAFFRYMETAEHEFFRALGLSITDHERHLGWPRVSCSFDFHSALRFPEEFEVHLNLTQISKRSVTYEARIVRDGAILASGRSISTCCRIDPAGALRAIDIPSDVAEKLRQRLTPRTVQAGKQTHEVSEEHSV